jgi:lysophospholipase L1-like esterase
MFECLILGDSIGVGVSQVRKECAAIVKGGINSWQFNKINTGEFFSGNVIISLGANDHRGVNTRKELEALRARVVAKNRVFWILPAIKPAIRDIIKDIAEKNGDFIIERPADHMSADGIHPTGRGYKIIGEQTL